MNTLLKRFQQLFIDQLKDVHNSTGNAIWIHKNNWQSALQTSLEDHYPYLLKLLGETCFKALVLQFIESNPSQETDLGNYGAQLAEFLASQALTEEHPYLPDIADFEWQCHSLMNHSPDSFPWHKLQNINAEFYDSLCFKKNCNCVLFESDYPVLEILTFCDQTTHQKPLRIHAKKNYYLLMATAHQIKSIPIAHADFIFLDSLFHGNSISTALNTIKSFTVDFKLEHKLPQWLNANIFRDVDLVS